MPSYSHAPIRAINKCAVPAATLERLPSGAADAGGRCDRTVDFHTHAVPCVDGHWNRLRAWMLPRRGQYQEQNFGRYYFFVFRHGAIATRRARSLYVRAAVSAFIRVIRGSRRRRPICGNLRAPPGRSVDINGRRGGTLRHIGAPAGPAAPWDCAADARPSRPNGPARAANSSGHGFEIFAAVRIRRHITFGPRSPVRAGRGATRRLYVPRGIRVYPRHPRFTSS